MTERQLEILHHSLGMDKKNSKKVLSWWLNNDNHRNHFCEPVGGDREDDLNILANLGLMSEGRTLNSGKDRYWHVTDEGIKVALERYPRGKK